jgi:hypothetical protein
MHELVTQSTKLQPRHLYHNMTSNHDEKQNLLVIGMVIDHRLLLATTTFSRRVRSCYYVSISPRFEIVTFE